MKRVIIPIVCFFIFIKEVLAGNYFDFIAINKLLDYQKETSVELIYKLDGYEKSDFLIRPMVEEGIPYILDAVRASWIPGNSLWNQLPSLQDEMKIKISNLGTTNFYFQIMNVTTGEIYETAKHAIWPINAYGDYLSRLNQNILKTPSL